MTGWVDDYDEESDEAACAILGEYEMARAQKRLTRSLKAEFDRRAGALPGPVRKHETARLLYFLTGIDEQIIGYLIRAVPVDIYRFFEPFPVTATTCGHGVEVETRRQAQRPPALCDRCAHRATPQKLFELPAAADHITPAAYYRHLRSAKWRRTRETKLASSPFCAVCGRTDTLDVHHVTYARFGDERLEDLTVLCRFHHDLFHDQREAK